MASVKAAKKPRKPRRNTATAVDVLMPAVEQLSVADRRKLIARIENTLPEVREPIETPDWHIEILEQRIAEAAANPGGGRPWREVLAELRKKR